MNFLMWKTLDLSESRHSMQYVTCSIIFFSKKIRHQPLIVYFFFIKAHASKPRRLGFFLLPRCLGFFLLRSKTRATQARIQEAFYFFTLTFRFNFIVLFKKN
jgi:hypothetical protein